MDTILEWMAYAMAFTFSLFLIALLVTAIVAILYWGFKPIIDDQNQRIADSKKRNPRVYGHLPDKVFPWDKDPA